MTWNIVSDSSCDLRTTDFTSEQVHFETVPLRLQVGERAFIDNDDLEAVREVLTSPYLTCGPNITEFEDRICSVLS